LYDLILQILRKIKNKSSLVHQVQ